MTEHPHRRRALLTAAAGLATLFGLSQGTSAFAASYGGTAATGWTPPLKIPSSTGLGEPTIIHDSGAGNSGGVRLFVTAPQSIGNINGSGGSPMFTSLDGGATWGPPVRSQACAGFSGGDTDLGVDGGDNIYQTDLWLGNACLSVSTDHGASFLAGDPAGSNLQPGDDRQWIVWNKISNQNYLVWDGVDALHGGNTAPIATPAAGIQVVQDTPVIPESAVNTSNTPDSVRECVCPPGGIAVDNTTGAHSGRVYVSYSYQHGIAISYSDLTGTCPACTANTTWTGPIAIPDASTGSAFDDEWNFAPIKVDSSGTVYLMWAHAAADASTSTGYGSVQEFYAYSTTGGTTWSTPVQLSTLGGTTTFPAMDVSTAPGVVDFTWYGDPAHAVDPNLANGPWNLYYERLSNANTPTPTISVGPVAAISGMHNGCIQAGGGAQCGDRSLLDFFDITETPCVTGGGSTAPNIIYTGGDVNAGVDLYFTKRPSLVGICATVGPTIPDTPLTALLVIPAAAAAFLGFSVHRRRRRAPS